MTVWLSNEDAKLLGAEPTSHLSPAVLGTVPRPSIQNLRAFLGSAVPRLWAYASTRADLRNTNARAKLRELVGWLLQKNGFSVHKHAPAPYIRDGKKVRGRLDLLALDDTGAAVLAIETDFDKDTASVHKLGAWHVQGVAVLWLVRASVDKQGIPGFRARANQVLGQDTHNWLQVCDIEHGWRRREPATAETSG